MSSISGTDLYIKQFNKQNRPISLSKWIHDHPTSTRVAQVVGAILGSLKLASLPGSIATLGVGVAFGPSIAGTVLLLSSLSSWLFVKHVTCAKHDIKEHKFQEAACPGGKLYYRGHVPVLELNGENPFEAGEAHGYLLGSHIYELKRNLEIAIHSILRQPRASALTAVLNQLREKIPSSYLQEMKGLSVGYNRWAQKAGVLTSMSEDDVLLMHLIPDSKHFHPGQIESKLGKFWQESDLGGAVACTSLLHRDPKNGVVFGRNMDWCPFGRGGEKSLVLVWKPQNIAVLGVPGMIGAITGWNQHHLSLAMNVSPGETSEVRGMPSILFNRQVLEKAQSVQEAESLAGKIRPLGPYHLTVADSTGSGASISFYQGKEKGEDHIRRLEEDKTLLVLNWRYPDCKEGCFNSPGRMELLNRYFQNAAASIPQETIDWRKLVEGALGLAPLVNSWITMHSLVFVPGLNEVSMSWDNGYAGSMPRERISMSGFFAN